MTKSELFKAAHKLTRETRQPGDSYRVTFGLCLKAIKANSLEKKTMSHTFIAPTTEIATIEMTIATEQAVDAYNVTADMDDYDNGLVEWLRQNNKSLRKMKGYDLPPRFLREIDKSKASLSAGAVIQIRVSF